MAQIDFRKKINWHRRYRSPQGVKTEHEILRIFESDRGRIINSPAIRRLQQKTQVFPLERNAAVRTRLTHSMEVQQVGRYIAKEILSRLKELKLLEAYGLDELTGPFESIVEMSCLMHDVLLGYYEYYCPPCTFIYFNLFNSPFLIVIASHDSVEYQRHSNISCNEV